MLIYSKHEKDFCTQLEKEFEPISFGKSKEKAYRAAVYLLDNTYLPCVLFRNSYRQADIASIDFDTARLGGIADARVGYRQIIRAYTTGNNVIASNIISKIEKSPYVTSTNIYKELAERMDLEGGGVSFLAKMEDEKTFDYFIDSNVEFIDVPQGYVASQVVDVMRHERRRDFQDLKEKFYFNCYFDCI